MFNYVIIQLTKNAKLAKNVNEVPICKYKEIVI